MFLVEPDKLDIKRHLCGFSIYHALIEDLMAKRQLNERKAGAVLFELADVANAL